MWKLTAVFEGSEASAILWISDMKIIRYNAACIQIANEKRESFPHPTPSESLTLQLYHEVWHPTSEEMLSRLKTGSSQFGVHRTWMESACATKTLTWRWFTAQWHDSHMHAFSHLSFSFKSTACRSTHQIFHRMVFWEASPNAQRNRYFKTKSNQKKNCEAKVHCLLQPPWQLGSSI